MFKKILVANRGEIAVRIIRACHELGIEVVSVYSEGDRDSLHVRLADEAVCIGPAPSRSSYLNTTAIISAALVTRSEAIHPGYGFLAENANFSEACEQSDLVFIGPRPEAIRLMGDKAMARKAMQEAGVPVVPGSDGIIESLEQARNVTQKMGFPMIMKAKDGGGGKGMRIVWSESELESAFAMATAEAEAAFGSGAMYMERFLEKPRHVEIQVAADSEGNVVHFYERDCSIQRRHQKLLEESPCPILTKEKRAQLTDTAVRGAQGIGYSSLGTMEFLLDEDGSFYFMEMNTRLQVEHPVTEMITGRDLVRLQISIAAGNSLPFLQQDIQLSGHAIECRINAEDPRRNFRPVPGPIRFFHAPGGPGVRVDSHLYSGYSVPSHYDSLLAKIIVKDDERGAAIARMKRALDELVIEGIPTTATFHIDVMQNEDFIIGKNVDTGFLRKYMPQYDSSRKKE
ncbi:MAG: acetyl-CoA carboxylase biotin carboxylase subunit [Candidatus Eisenbacteria bacterium]|uniref:Biotin carboxylase n=1 Tax=Eiseniibacteriota bacterium TaxID=2212470 RepID=A0A948W5N5_UNCEI|nr:acetyl-CoA carboxylase biotin carboxylase subunit [Candidatus Eisenbacteria bacterium]MBU2690609.1 acetyl-CoA carboxylase biotin carboxylase subunit [Candidatus Eisenbacteria bacterium]